MNKLYYTWNNLESDVADITQQMATNKLIPHVVFGPGRGGYIPGVMLSHYFGVPFHGFEWQHLDFDVQEKDHLRTLLSKYNGKRIVIIDDINDTGTTMQGISNIVNLMGMEKNVKFITLFDKLSSSFGEVQITANEVAPEDEKWIVYPWEEWWK
jgi:hypoxanthine phosphoribosyltransferase|tara:strand:+ start:1064 stop:1525 length:462 start_codon:yes stop_codon:yes gene_type:complete